jgi:HK97 gp10 family phage protein
MAVQAISAADLQRTFNKLKALRGQITRRQFKSALRKGANIIRNEARKNVPIAAKPYRGPGGEMIQPGFVRDAIEVKSLRRSEALFVGVVKKDAKLPFWAQWLEFGARNRDGSTRPGFGFMRRAVASKKEDAIAAIVKAGEVLINKVVKKLSIK